MSNYPDNVSASDPYFEGVSDGESDMMNELAALERAQEAYGDMATELSSISLDRVVNRELGCTIRECLAAIETAMRDALEDLKQKLGVE